MYRSALITATSRLTSLSRSGHLSLARELFEEMPDRDVVAWNAMLTAYSRSAQPHLSLSLFSRMLSSSPPRPDPFSLTAALSASSDLRTLSFGRSLHSLSLRLGLLPSSLPVANSLINMYSKCSRRSDAELVFDSMASRNVVSWCSLLDCYVNCGSFAEAEHFFVGMPVRNTVAWNVMIAGRARRDEFGSSVGLFKRMIESGHGGDFSTFSSLVNACARLDDPRFGHAVHAAAFRRGWVGSVEVDNSLISFYSRFGSRDDAVKVFESMGSRSQVSWNAMIDAHMKADDVEAAVSSFRSTRMADVVSWTSMIGGFARNGHGEEALVAFVDMMKSLLRPDDFTLGAVLYACATLAVLANGRMIHGYVVRCGFGSVVYVGNGLVNMYAKCGDIESSSKVFGAIATKDLVSWNAMIFGFALHGWASRALEVYRNMVGSEVLPDKVTFVGLLMACSHSGLIEQGRDMIENMDSVHGIPPDVDHMTCVVDMLGRAGYLREARELLDGCSKMSSEGSTFSSEALLSACAVSGDTRIGSQVGKGLVSMEPENETGYVMLSNLYCASGQWREAEWLRRAMREQGVKKAPGCSWIEVRDVVMVFVSGSHSVACTVDVREMLGLLELEMRNPSFNLSVKES
ncbi:pentatricopeptide repeat-containing protein-like isoform X1, mitochondrial [Iris pallida]|uniref:Pentatricopeptide repeat-containing protein-like isoform X1, mitochondrial n=1 Tax=Iris pallida TaxID=29817 RepID=A0AAX6F4Z5_IRIPA|nr:pentatricopeptide repeat-containing protein-like isoform X1, mitochondrial [Iris pallida]